MEATATGVAVIPILLIYILMMLVVAIFVYKDAKKRRMNGVAIWTLIAFFVPFFIGAIIYFACRAPLVEFQCSNCGAPVEKNENVCQKCGSQLMVNCPQCKFPIKKGWKNCPQCGVELPESYNQPVKSYKRESGLGVVMLILVIALIVICVVPVSMCAVKNSGSGSYGFVGEYGMYNITEDDLSGNATLKKWIEDSKNSKKSVNVITSTVDGTMYIYIKDSEYLLNNDMYEYTGSEDSMDITINIIETEYGDEYGYDFFMYDIDGNNIEELVKNMDIKVLLNGDNTKCKLTITDEDISRETWRD